VGAGVDAATSVASPDWQLTVGPECWSIFDDGVQALATLMAGREERVRDLCAQLGLKVAVVVKAATRTELWCECTRSRGRGKELG
jgi:hypothetical protein